MREDEARGLVADALAARGYEGAWDLRAIPGGWIVDRDTPGLIGTVTYFVEATTGDLVAFPSSVPPALLELDYGLARRRGTVVTTGT